MKYDVFISYSRKDSNIAQQICKAFEQNGISYFIDQQGIGGGFEFPEVLAEAILNSRVILFLASKNSYVSKFTNSELTFAFNEKSKNSILPYIIDGSTMPPALRLVFSSINWRTIESHPIETTLIADILKMLGREGENAQKTTTVAPKHKEDNIAAPSELKKTSLPQQAATRNNEEYVLDLLDASSSKLLVVKYLSQMPGWGLAQSKEFVDNLPAILLKGVSKTHAESVAQSLVQIGAKVEVYHKDEMQYELILLDAGMAKLAVVKTVKDLLGLSLAEAKEYVDKVPVVLKRNLSKGRAEFYAQCLDECGATAEVRRRQAKNYKVGDYYNENGVEGVVFEVDASGHHGKIVSMQRAIHRWAINKEYGFFNVSNPSEKEIGANNRVDGMVNMRVIQTIEGWQEKYPAFAWCASLGTEWYLPAIDELKLLLLNDSVHDAVNKTLKEKGGIKLANKKNDMYYWSSTENGNACACYVYMRVGHTYYRTKRNDYYVCAVSAF